MLGAAAPARAAGTTNVPCGNVTALVAAINAANANADADTINVTGAPCSFVLNTPSAVGTPAGNNTGLPLITNDLTILGNGATIERAAGAALQFRIMFAFGATAKLHLQDLTIKGGRLNTAQVAAGLGGIAAPISLERVTVTDNQTSGGTAAAGGGIWTSGGSLTVDRSTISANVATISAAMSLNQTTPVTIRRSLFANNNANTVSGSGGVSWIQGGIVTFENDTFANNTATNGVGGVVVSNAASMSATANFDSATFSGNGSSIYRLPAAGGGTATINVARTIVAGTCAGTAPIVVSGGNNIESPGSTCVFGAGNTVDPKLAPLASNGGPTQTMRPLFDSPAIDRVVGACPATDQRDIARPDGPACDTGAYETPSPETTATGTVGMTNNPQITFNSSDTPSATFRCNVNNAGFTGCTSPFSPSVGTGTHTVLVRAVEPTGGYLDKSPASVTLNVDKTAPVVTITPAPITPTNDDTPTVTFTVNDGSATTTCDVDSTGPEPCSSPYTTPPLTGGSHTITVFATDALGNTGSASTTIVVDLAPSNTIPVPCGDVAALKNAITAANATFAHDTIDVTGGPCTFTLTTVADAAAGGSGLPIVVHPLTVEGQGSTIARSTAVGTPNFRIWFASGASDANTTLTLHDMSITGGSVTGTNVGGGVAGFVAGIRLDKVSVYSNAAGLSGGYGGGVATIGGTLDVDRSMIFSNTASNGAGLSTNQTPGIVRRSLLFGNAAASSTGGALIQGSTVNFENVTVAGNVAVNGLGGIAVTSSGAITGTVNVDSSTLYNNRRTNVAAPANALFALAAGDAIHVRNSIVTDDSLAPATAVSCAGTVTNDGGNLEWPGTTCGFATNANPQLGAAIAYPPGANGYPLLPTSPAIDLGGATCPATDQFDKPRPDGAACDTGAFEAPEPETTANGPANDPTNDPQITFNSPDTPGAAFQCKVNALAYATCGSPFTPLVGDGTHTVLVRAVAAGGYVDRTPASVTFTVDKTGPVVDITSAPPAPPAATGDNTATIEFTVDDPDAIVTCKVGALEPVTCSSPFTTDALTDGQHTIVVTATDPVGNAGSDSATFIVDTVPSAVIDVPCGDVIALRAAITAANATLAGDTINVSGGPCTFTLNDSVDATAGGNGLPIVIHPLTVEGHGATIERSVTAGTPNFRIWFVWGNVDPAAALTLRDVTVLRGSLSGNNVGAGVAALQAHLNLDGVIIQQNIAAGGSGNGAGVWIYDGTLAIEDSSFYFNQSATGAALATTLTPGTVRRSTFYLNGGGITASGATAWVQGETVTFENTTIAGNAASNGIGGIVASNSGDTSGVVNIVSSTLFAQRRTGIDAPAAHLFAFHQTGLGTQTINVTDSIVSDTSTGTPVSPACAGVTDGTGNIEWPGTSCGFGTHADPQLDPALNFHGATTLNYRLQPTSPAIDLAGATCPAADQRGVARPDGEACDAGSYETPAPDTIATGPSADPTNSPQITFSSPDTPAATFQCKIDDGAFTSCVSPFTPAVGDGPHTVLVRAVHPEGYLDLSPASVSFTVDTTAPVVDITVAPASPTSDDTPTIEFTVDDPAATVECQVDGGARTGCSSPFTSSALPEGFHSITVYATDAVGNEGSDSVTIAISFGPPNTVIDSGPSGTIYNKPSSTFTFHSTKANSTFECSFDSGGYAPCTSPRNVSYAEGAHTFRVRAVDVAGVRDPTPATRNFTSKKCAVLRLVVDIFGNPTVLCL